VRLYRHAAWFVALATTVVVGATPRVDAVPTTAPGPITHQVSLTVGGGDGSGDSLADGLPCPGKTAPVTYWHMGYETDLPTGFGPAPAALRLHMAARSDTPGGAWLEGTESTATLANPRGSVVLRLTDGGACGNPTATLTNDTVATSGTWALATGTGPFANGTGAGTFTLSGGVAPGAANPWTLHLGGTIDVPRPNLAVSVVQTYWGALGLDYLTGTVSVVYQVTNAGPGAAYGVRVTGLTSPTAGASFADSPPGAAWDLAPGQSAQFTERWHLGPLQPCALALNCAFTTVISGIDGDALDAALTFASTVQPVSPSLPVKL
jgi:hypothetical protein